MKTELNTMHGIMIMQGRRGNGERESDIRYLSFKYNEFCKKWNGRELTPAELNKFENLLRYGDFDYEKY